MSVIVQHRRGTRAEAEAATPAAGELWFDTTLKAQRVGDGAQAGGFLAKRWGRAWTIVPAQITANQNDYNPTDLNLAEVLELTSDAARTVTGLAGGSAHRVVWLVNNGSFTITLAHNSGSSSAANRMLFGGTDFQLRARYAVALLYLASVSLWVPLTDALSWKTVNEIPENFRLTGVVTPAQITANQNDYTPGIAAAAVLRLSTDASRNITGLIYGAGSGGIVEIINVGANPIVFKNADAGSTATARFDFGNDITLSAKNAMLIWYDGTDARWKLISSTAGAAVADGAVTAVKRASSSFGPRTGMINGTLAESRAGNAVTFALKTLAGADPSASDPVRFVFQDGAGGFAQADVTAALSFTFSSGSSAGAVNGTAFRIHVVAVNNAGTVVLGAVNCVSGTDIMPLHEHRPYSTTAEGGAGAADSAQVIYTAAAQTSKYLCLVGFATYESGLAAAGTWNAAPSSLALHGPGVPRPGQPVQAARSASGAVATGTTAIPFDDSIPQNTEGTQFFSKAITPASAAHILHVRGQFVSAINAATGANSAALFQDSVANALAATYINVTGTNYEQLQTLDHRMLSGVSVSTTFKLRAGSNSGADTYTINGASAARFYGGVMNSFLEIVEYAT